MRPLLIKWRLICVDNTVYNFQAEIIIQGATHVSAFASNIVTVQPLATQRHSMLHSSVNSKSSRS